MIAVDTNLVVRYLVGDEPTQAAQARALFHERDIWISDTVLLETAWVIGKVYGYRPDQIAWAFRLMAGLPSVTLQSPGRVMVALGWLRDLDVADAMHLAQAHGAEAFATFDQGLIKAAQSLACVPVREPSLI